MASWRAPESAADSKERRVNNALSARRRPPRLVWSEERERKRTLDSPISTLCLRMSECRNAGAEKRERAEASGGERKTVRQHGGNGGAIHGSFALALGRERKAWGGMASVEQSKERRGLTSRVA